GHAHAAATPSTTNGTDGCCPSGDTNVLAGLRVSRRLARVAASLDGDLRRPGLARATARLTGALRAKVRKLPTRRAPPPQAAPARPASRARRPPRSLSLAQPAPASWTPRRGSGAPHATLHVTPPAAP